jgi:hypothetical protein
MTSKPRSQSRLRRAGWLLATLAMLAVLAGHALARPSVSGETTTSLAPSVSEADDDPNKKDDDYGAPKKKLPKNPTGWGDNQDATLPKKFPHYGRVEFKLCDLPFDKDKGGQFNKWSDANQRSWARKQLPDMTAAYTNHELVEEVNDGMGGKMKVLAIYKVDKADHESSGRPKMYHPRNPGQETYFGGISQMKDLPDHLFKKQKPPPKKKDKQPTSTTTTTLSFGPLAALAVPITDWWPPEPAPDPDPEPTCEGETCVICGPCARTPEEAADWCGEGEGSECPAQ